MTSTPPLLGHCGIPGLNFIYAHLDGLIRLHDSDMIFLAGQGARQRERRPGLVRRRHPAPLRARVVPVRRQCRLARETFYGRRENNA
jgi:XFP N-terminal domain